MLDESKRQIVFKLLEKDDYTTSEELARLIKVSSRSIVRYIKDINYFIKRFDAEITSSKGLGYRLYIPSAKLDMLKGYIQGYQKVELIDSNEERSKKVIRLLCNERYLTLEIIAREMTLSITSVSKLLNEVKRILKEYNLTIESLRSRGIYISGKEEDVRYMLIDLLMKDDEESIINYLKNISLSEILAIRETIKKEFTDTALLITDFDFKLLELLYIITISRIKSNSMIKDLITTAVLLPLRNISKSLSFKLGIEIDDGSQAYVEHIFGDILNSYLQSLGEEEYLNEFIDKSLDELSPFIDKTYLSDPGFKEGLRLHVKLFINRALKGVKTDNPILAHIRSSIPFELNVATIFATKIEKAFSVKFTEGELGYIALHFAALEERAKNIKRKKVIIICNYGLGTSQLLQEKIKARFEDVKIEGVYPMAFLELALGKKPDLIISTIKLSKEINIPQLYVENILSDDIYNKMSDILHRRNDSLKLMAELISEDTFYKLSAGTKEEALVIMGNKLIEKELTTREVMKSIYSREKMSSTDLGNLIAIPHAISIEQQKSLISIGILEKPIFWEKEYVQLIVLSCFSGRDKKNLSVFKGMYSLVKDADAIKALIKNPSYKHMKKILGID